MSGKEKVKKTERKIKKPTRKTKPKSQQDRKFELKFFAPEAKNVTVAGEFNDWDTETLPMKKTKDGTWKAKIKLSPGRYEYRFFVDGVWAEAIPGVEIVPNPFGTYNFVVTVE